MCKIVQYSTVVQLQPLGFHCVDRCRGLNPGPLHRLHWLTDALASQIEIIYVVARSQCCHLGFCHLGFCHVGCCHVDAVIWDVVMWDLVMWDLVNWDVLFWDVVM